MKTLAVFALLFSMQGFGWENSFKITATGGSPIPIAFDNGDAQSLVASAMSTNRVFCVFNETSIRVAINTEQRTSATPSTVTHYVPAGGFICDENRVKYLFIKSDGAAITAGVVHGYFR